LIISTESEIGAWLVTFRVDAHADTRSVRSIRSVRSVRGRRRRRIWRRRMRFNGGRVVVLNNSPYLAQVGGQVVQLCGYRRPLAVRPRAIELREQLVALLRHHDNGPPLVRVIENKHSTDIGA
jgi:hypothetical protein